MGLAQIDQLFLRAKAAGVSVEQFLGELSAEEIATVASDWRMLARPEQLEPPGIDWTYWLAMAGRGWGKTRVGAEWANLNAERWPGSQGILIAQTPADYRDVMIEGESGILSCARPDFEPDYYPSKRRVQWPNGSYALCFSAHKPRALRGPQSHWIWGDEFAAWQFPESAWSNAKLGLRLPGPWPGFRPVACLTTTPKNIPAVRKLVKNKRTTISRGSTYDNAANLAQSFIEEIVGDFEGTSLGRQELYGELMEDAEGALWKRAWIEAVRIGPGQLVPDLVASAVGVDPAASSGPNSAETGIVVGGRAANNHGYILADRSLRGTPEQWGRVAVAAYHEFRCDYIAAEVNNGGDMVVHVIHSIDPGVPVRKVTATRGKQVRAQPVAARYEQGRVHHVGTFGDLEGQLCTWEPDVDPRSPDRLDALVWVLTATLLTGSTPQAFVVG